MYSLQMASMMSSMGNAGEQPVVGRSAILMDHVQQLLATAILQMGNQMGGKLANAIKSMNPRMDNDFTRGVKIKVQ